MTRKHSTSNQTSGRGTGSRKSPKGDSGPSRKSSGGSRRKKGEQPPLPEIRLTLDQYLALDHIVVSPLGRPSHVDAVLAERGLARRIRRIVPFFNSGLLLAAATDDVLTVSDRAAVALAPTLGLRLVEPPLPLASYSLNLLWHPRLENEPANRWLRDVFVRAAKEAMPAGRKGPGHEPDRRARPRRSGRKGRPI